MPRSACSAAQRDVYEAVLEVHRACLAACRPGATLRHLHHLSVRLLSEALAQARSSEPRPAAGLAKPPCPTSASFIKLLSQPACPPAC